MWKFEFDQPVGARILRSRFFGVTNYDDYWYDLDQKRWHSPDERTNGHASNYATCRSFKAFKRHLRKHPELRKASEVHLRSRYVDYNIVAKWVE